VVKYKPAHQSSFRQTAIKTGIFVVSAFFLGYLAFGKPKLFAKNAEHPWPSVSGDSIRGQAGAIYARLSPQSRQFLSNLCDQVNHSGTIPDGYFYPEKLALEAIAKWGRSFSENPLGVLEALKDAEKYARAFQNRSEADRIAYMNAAAQLQFFRALHGSTPEQQKAFLDDALKTYVVPAEQDSYSGSLF